MGGGGAEGGSTSTATARAAPLMEGRAVLPGARP